MLGGAFAAAGLMRGTMTGAQVADETKTDAIGQGSSDEYVRLGKARSWLSYGNSPNGNTNAFKTALSWLASTDLIH